MLDLYKNIKKYRLEQGLSQEALAKKAGYTDRSSIAKIENGLVDLSLTKIKAFADALCVDPGELMGEAWQEEVLDNTRSDVAKHLNYDAFSIAQFCQAQDADQREGQQDVYYLNPDAAAMAQEISENPELHMLFSALRDSSPEDLKLVADMVKRFKGVD